MIVVKGKASRKDLRTNGVIEQDPDPIGLVCS
jgi:hypothetical protein